MELPPARYSPELPHPARTHRSYEPSVLINRLIVQPVARHALAHQRRAFEGHSAASADAVLEAVLRGAPSTQASTTPSFLALMARDLLPAHATRLIEALCASCSASPRASSLLASAPRLAEGITVDDDDYSVAVASLATSRAEKALRAEVKTLRQALLGTHTAAHYLARARRSARSWSGRCTPSHERRRTPSGRHAAVVVAGGRSGTAAIHGARRTRRTRQVRAPGARRRGGDARRSVPRPPDKYRPRVGGPTVGGDLQRHAPRWALKERPKSSRRTASSRVPRQVRRRRASAPRRWTSWRHRSSSPKSLRTVACDQCWHQRFLGTRMIYAVYSLLAIHLHIPTRSAVAPSRVSLPSQLRRPSIRSQTEDLLQLGRRVGRAVARSWSRSNARPRAVPEGDALRRLRRAPPLLGQSAAPSATPSPRRASLLALDAEPERWHRRRRAARPRASTTPGRRRPRGTPRRRVARVRPVPGDLDRHAAPDRPHARTLRALPAVHRRVASMIETLIDNRPMRRNGRKQPVGAYLRYRSARARLLHAEVGGTPCRRRRPDARRRRRSSRRRTPTAAGRAPRGAVCHCSTGRLGSKTSRQYIILTPSPVPSGGRGGAPRARAVGRDGVRRSCRQLAFRAASDDVSFDVVVLAYSLYLHYHLAAAADGRARGWARGRRSRCCGLGVAPPLHNARLVATALDAVFEQMRGGLWPKGSRSSFTRRRQRRRQRVRLRARHARLAPRGAAGRGPPPHTRDLVGLAWLSEHLVTEPAPPSAIGRCSAGGRTTSARGRLLTWSTAQAMRCISRTRKLVRSSSPPTSSPSLEASRPPPSIQPTGTVSGPDLPSGVVDGGGDEAAFVEKHDKDGDGHLDEEELTSAMAAGDGEGTPRFCNNA